MSGLLTDVCEFRKTDQALTIQQDQYDDMRTIQRENHRERKKARKRDAERADREERQDYLDSNPDIRDAMTFKERLDFYKSGTLPTRLESETAPAEPTTAPAPAPAFDMAAFADMVGKAVKQAVDEALA